MKNIIIKTGMLLMLVVWFTSCDDFEDVNTKPDAFTSEEVSAKFFVTGTQNRLYAPGRYAYWRANIITADRYSGHITFGSKNSWWSGGLGYTYNASYTNAAFDYFDEYIGRLNTLMSFVEVGGDLENEKYYAIALIMKGLYYQMYTDAFGMIPYSEVGNVDVVAPKFDTQDVLYEGVIAELNEAMTIIGDATVTGEGVEVLSDNDLFFNGDLQKWKKLANTLKLRMALRAEGATGATFAETAISEALSEGLITAEDDNVTMEKDTEISQWDNAAYGDVWYNFGAGSNWSVGKTLIDYLRNNNDPRLSKYAQPIAAAGGDVTFLKPTAGSGVALFDKHVNFIIEQLDNAGVSYTRVNSTDQVKITIAAGDYYVGQPTRLNSDIQTHIYEELFSMPADLVINPKNQGLPIFDEIVMTAAEGNYLQAEAIVKGLASGDAQTLYQEGLTQAMKLWDVSDDEIAMYIANEDMAMLNGTMDENLEKIAVQRWIASFTDGFEAWAIIRDTGYPKELAQGVSDYDIYSGGTLNGVFPQRLRYGSGAYNTNGDNTEAANQVQGSDEQATKLWWAK
ncbi:SusD/RagB family nutrient-binding outer membrane lipoprotein [Aureibaculum sp. A20]|uniref:SusD/RagB family nutrient-binding outer membrane lipoprotein n=1 Tax=Aureibaculum flavum TaxID=2795986 RepID=A0ABS0WS14_9FLAO|nr:SusD/RagB family nutrient-binding outer membrane lipoprotein [Aureibaculum flavum]MBJ2174663.1 SusD/RagB family nutrient-binding outer membrane lipoprotein [Aureibaculum flavum]